MKFSLLAALLLLGVCGALTGCSSEPENKAPTADELKAFKGGTPPPDVQKKMQEGMSKGSKGAKIVP
ncbi:MAG: hypothetical protein QM758_08515 [Armatimonas sp.]